MIINGYHEKPDLQVPPPPTPLPQRYLRISENGKERVQSIGVWIICNIHVYRFVLFTLDGSTKGSKKGIYDCLFVFRSFCCF